VSEGTSSGRTTLGPTGSCADAAAGALQR
jgi:hypothetical protein